MEAAREAQSERKIESKDHMWKPAPIVGREFNQREVEVQPFPSAQVTQMRDHVLPTAFMQQPAIPDMQSNLPDFSGSLPSVT